ncbi:MAG: hypothetical protein GY765_10775 [bacterium]|nr:hypothetical protein [bacterium]
MLTMNTVKTHQQAENAETAITAAMEAAMAPNTADSPSAGNEVSPAGTGSTPADGNVPDTGQPPDDGQTNGDDQTTPKPKSKAYAALMQRYRTALTSAVKPKYADRLTEFGYLPERLAEGPQLVTVTENKDTEQAQLYATYTSNILGFPPLLREARDMLNYTSLLIKAAVLNDPDNHRRLGLTEKRKYDFPSWLNQNRKLYATLLDTPEVLDRLAAMGVTPEQLQEEQQKIRNLGTLYGERATLKAAAQKATEEKDKAFQDLKTWMGDFFRVFRMAFRDDPQMMEAVGIVKK